ncbi:MAG TPA: DUF711 family protein [Terriglobales bacterium]|nr:DUF711 family protein [Terriglobales bacterium]
MRARLSAVLLVVLIAATALAQTPEAVPKVRTVTAFIKLDRSRYRAQIAETLVKLREVKAAFEQAGYEVQTIRITTQPFPEYVRGLSKQQVLTFFRDYDALARKENFAASIGPAMGLGGDDSASAELLGEILGTNGALNGSIIVAGEDGIRWEAVRAAARVMKYLEEHTEHSRGNFNFAASAMLPPHTPFFPGSYHDDGGGEFAVGLQSANVVATAFAGASDAAAAGKALESALGAHARRVEEIARQMESKTGWKYMGLDLSPAPMKDVSIGAAIENLTHARFGSSGTMNAVATITGVLRGLPVQHAGYSGLMLPILEDSVLAERWNEGRLNVDDMLAYSAICGTGLDTIPLPGDVSQEQLEKMIGDMATLAVRLHKPLSARLLPVSGKKAGERTEFDNPFLGNAVLQPLP